MITKTHIFSPGDSISSPFSYDMLVYMRGCGVNPHWVVMHKFIFQRNFEPQGMNVTAIIQRLYSLTQTGMDNVLTDLQRIALGQLFAARYIISQPIFFSFNWLPKIIIFFSYCLIEHALMISVYRVVMLMS